MAGFPSPPATWVGFDAHVFGGVAAAHAFGGVAAAGESTWVGSCRRRRYRRRRQSTWVGSSSPPTWVGSSSPPPGWGRPGVGSSSGGVAAAESTWVGSSGWGGVAGVAGRGWGRRRRRGGVAAAAAPAGLANHAAPIGRADRDRARAWVVEALRHGPGRNRGARRAGPAGEPRAIGVGATGRDRLAGGIGRRGRRGGREARKRRSWRDDDGRAAGARPRGRNVVTGDEQKGRRENEEERGGGGRSGRAPGEQTFDAPGHRREITPRATHA